MFLRTIFPWVAALLRLSEAATGEFNVLSLNVAGLPDIFNGNDVPGDKKTNAGSIGSRLAEYGYDVAHLQEDFNYHAYIYETDDHENRTPTSGGVPFGSGLNTVSNYAWDSFERMKWDDCSLNSGDCLTPKGFTAMRLNLAEGVTVDLYNFHADAGSDSHDVAARKSNFQQVADYIKANSAGNAVIAFGDTNFRYTTQGEFIRDFLSQAELKDPWVELIRNGDAPAEGIDAILCDNPSTINTCETVDKIFYRSGDSLTLEATYWNYESPKFLQENGDILSDHNPITANFTWTSK